VRGDLWVLRAAARRPDREAVNGISYAELAGRAAEAAAGLVARGVRPGERVGLALTPGTDLVVLLHACWMAGAVAVPHDLRLTEAERPRADHVVDAVAPRPVDGTPLRREHDLAATAVLLQTSGTSGAPKPVELSFGNLLWSALGSGVALGTQPAERWLCALPLSHVGGLGIVVRSSIGATTALVHPGWDTERVLGALEREGVTLVSVVPTTLARLLDAGLRHPPHLRCALAGGAPVPPALVGRALEAGIPVAQTYGLTEATSQVTTAAPGDTEADAGPPLFCTRVRIGPDGEIHVTGPTVAGPPGRELATGDLGALDAAGRLTVTGRKADTIVSGGENVAPAEVEAVLAEHPAVSEAVVLGRPHPEWGEAVVAQVVLRPGAHASEAELRRHAAARLAGFKVPKEIAFASALPRTRSGKILRRALRP
jgi:O-succinylbenzoic acid--CoA ligase